LNTTYDELSFSNAIQELGTANLATAINCAKTIKIDSYASRRNPVKFTAKVLSRHDPRARISWLASAWHW